MDGGDKPHLSLQKWLPLLGGTERRDTPFPTSVWAGESLIPQLPLPSPSSHLWREEVTGKSPNQGQWGSGCASGMQSMWVTVSLKLSTVLSPPGPQVLLVEAAEDTLTINLWLGYKYV